jgi:hypothetical protein
MLAVLGLVGSQPPGAGSGDLLLQFGQGAVGPIGGVGLDPGAVQRDHAQADQAGRGAQAQGLDQEVSQRLLVPDAEPGDGHTVERLVAGQHPEGEILVAAPLDLPRRADPGAVGVQQHAEQQPRVVGGMAVPVVAVRSAERPQVELVDQVQDEPAQVAVRQPVAQVWGSRNGRSRSSRKKS